MLNLNLNTKKANIGLLIILIFLINFATVAVFVYKFENQKTPIFDDGNVVFDTENKLRTSDTSSIFDGLYIKYNYTSGASFISNFSYSQYSGNLFNEAWNIVGIGIYSWLVDIQTRVMTGGSIFGDGSHTPAWIFTDVNLGDSILIAVDSEGDHTFNISRELTYDLPGIRDVEDKELEDLPDIRDVDVWELEDLTQPGGIAWYEKSTGILLNGTFTFDGGMSNDDFEFIWSNAFPGFFDNFENDLNKWQTITGLWHLTDSGSLWPDPYHSPTHSMWFGDESTGNYDTGFREMGDLISEPFSLMEGDKAELEFYQWREGEGDVHDESFVYISTDGSNWDLLYRSYSSYISPWERVVLDISKYIGNVSVQIRFYFETYDSLLNDYRGWLVDDVRVLAYHDLSVSLEVPVNPHIYNTYSINATVYNTGYFNEANVYLQLYLNGGFLVSQSITSLPIGANETINFMWTPTEYGHYNFTASASPVPDDEYMENNMESQILVVFNQITGPVAIFRNLLPWSMNVTEPILDMYNINYTVYDSSDIGIVDLSPFEKVIIASDQDQTFYNTLGFYTPWFESYATNGGILEIHAADYGWNRGTWDGLYLMPGGFDQVHGSLYNITINQPLHPVLSYPHIITDTSGDSAHGYFDTYPGISEKILLDGNTLAPVFLELDYGEGTILITMQTLEHSYYYGNSEFLENVILFDPDSLMITTPSSASSWDINTSQTIYWTSTGTVSDVKIELYKDNVFAMEIISSTTNDGEFSWNILPTLEESDQYQIKILEISYPSTFDYSDYFEIIIPSITITTPNSTSSWETGSSQTIYWTSTGTVSDVKIELYKDNVFAMEIISSTTNDGEFSWNILPTLEESDQYQIKITDVSNPSTFDYSDYFEIIRPSRRSRIPGYSIYILIGLIGLVSLIFTRKFYKTLKN